MRVFLPKKFSKSFLIHYGMLIIVELSCKIFFLFLHTFRKTAFVNFSDLYFFDISTAL